MQVMQSQRGKSKNPLITSREGYHLSVKSIISLDELVHFYNTRRTHEETQEIPLERWNKALKERRSTLRHLPNNINLDTIFSLHFQRTVKSDGCFSFQGTTYRLKHLQGKRTS